MSLNPPLLPGHGMPLPVNGETFIVQRRGMRFEAELRGMRTRKFDSHGTLYLSTLRMVFVPNGGGSGGGGAGWLSFLSTGPQCEGFQGYDLPLSLLQNERFNQPIFGCNNIDGDCVPLPGTDGITHFKLSFYEGGCGTFLPIFFDLLNRFRAPADAPSAGGFRGPVSAAGLARQAYVDPNDPTHIFLAHEQPSHAGSLSHDDYYRLGPAAASNAPPPPTAPARGPFVIPTATAPHVIPTATAPVDDAAPSAPPGWAVVSPGRPGQ